MRLIETSVRAPWTLAALAIAPLLVAAAQAPPQAAAHRPAPGDVLDAAPAGTVLRDDDDGRVQIVPRHPISATPVIDHGGPVVERESLQLVFLGSGWLEDAPRSLERRVTDAVTAGHHVGAPAFEDPVDPPGHQSISDLAIQHRLADLLASERQSDPPEQGTVYVVFLAPGLEGTLGAHSSSTKDFAAYHNYFHASEGLVRYVVVPYDESFELWVSAARQSLVQALINPEGNGWY